MAILANVKNKIGKLADRGANMIATASSMSSEQLDEVEKQRQAFMHEKPETEPEGIKRLLGAYAIEAFEAYLPQIETLYEPIPISSERSKDNRYIQNRVTYFEITKWVSDPSEDNVEKLVNVYQVVSGEDCSVALIYNRKKDACRVFLEVVYTDLKDDKPTKVTSVKERIQSALEGNFPGVCFKDGKTEKSGPLPECMTDLRECSVAAISNIATEKSENFLNQGMEKLLDGIRPKDEKDEYTVVLLATPVMEQLERKNELTELYSKLAPFANWQTNFTYTEQNTQGSSAVVGVNLGASAGRQTGNANMMGENRMHSETDSVSRSHTESKQNTMGLNVPGPGGANGSLSRSKGTSDTEGTGHAATDAIGNMRSSTKSTGLNFGFNFGVNFSRSLNVSVSIGKNEGLTQTFTNYGIKYTLDMIEKQIKRLEESSALGMWDFSAYVISKNSTVVKNAACMYLALTQGDDSYLAQSAVNCWKWENDTAEKSEDEVNKDLINIYWYLSRLQHPQFQMKKEIVEKEKEWLLYPSHVDTTVCLTGRELARSMNFPRQSVSGFPVLDVVSFGREPHMLTDGNLDMELGYSYHMRKIDEGQRIGISMQELTKHTFITGSTGSGKSNTVYKLLEKAKEKKIPFLVIEPAKGEYKDAVGKWEGVTTYGTNPKLEDEGIAMLRINPFRFPSETHILEHLDRLVEIFNVCWPMYAAMPAILKDAVERAYVSAGWDLEKSENKYGEQIYPTFADVVKQIKVVLDESEYSADNKGDYTGSLVTRLRSLTNGINGLIFTNDDIEDENLFDKQVIVDLSRVGSSETKSLIMGLLVLKLQEYRAEKRTKSDDELKHITVLEEAHNLLKRTSTEQVGEGANMIGKSVEMLANSIAEMRTYGEGFVIVDQSPGLLDMSVIRNTNTKIILRLPDFSDRQLVGKAAGLSDDQITELSRLERGVAVLSQSDWLEPVLCKIDCYNKENYENEDRYNAKTEEKKNKLDNDKVRQSLLECIMNKEIYRKGDRIDIEKLRKDIIQSKLDAAVKCKFMEYISSKDDVKAFESLRKMVYEFLNAGQAFERASDSSDIVEWVHAVANHLEPKLVKENSTGEALYTKQQMDLVMALLVYEQSLRDATYKDVLIKFWEMYESEGGVY